MDDQRYRGIGRSHAIAFEMLAAAYRSPKTWIKIYDHDGGNPRTVFNIIARIVDKLSLDRIEQRVNNEGCFIRMIGIRNG